MGNLSSQNKRKYKHDEEQSEKHSKRHEKHEIKEHKSGSSNKDGVPLDWSIRESSPTTKSKGPRSTKIANLIRALNAVLDIDETVEEDDLLDDESLKHSSNLRNVLQLHIMKQKTRDFDPVISSQAKPADQANVAKSMPANTVQPWTSSTIPDTLPPLPEVLDPTLEAGVFIHQGDTSGNIGDLSYERLEWVGDAYLYLTATLLISQTFPALLPGKCSQLRERLVKNVTLAGYARQYGFHKRQKVPPTRSGGDRHSQKESDKTKILGDIFEAYIAAIILSDPVNGVARCSEWLKGLWGMTLQKEIVAQDQEGQKIDSPLWRLRGIAEPVKLTVSKSEYSLNAKDRLRASIVSKGISLTYKDAGPVTKHPETKLPIFTVGVYLDGWGEKNKQLGFGSAYSKKEAGMKAAEMALRKTHLIKIFVEKKQLYDAHLELERKALEES